MGKLVVRDGFVGLIRYSTTNTLEPENNQVIIDPMGANLVDISSSCRIARVNTNVGSEDGSTFGSGGWAQDISTVRRWTAELSGFTSIEEARAILDVLEEILFQEDVDANDSVGLLVATNVDKYAQIEVPKLITKSDASPRVTLAATANRRAFVGIANMAGDVSVVDREFGQLERFSLPLTGVGRLAPPFYEGLAEAVPVATNQMHFNLLDRVVTVADP